MELPKKNPFRDDMTAPLTDAIKDIMEGKINEGGVKAAIEDFMYDMLPKQAIAELKPIFKNQGIRGGMLRAKVTAVLKKYKVPLMHLGGSSAQLVIDYFDTFHGESVEEAYAPLDTPGIIGAFTEATKKKRFEYRNSTDSWGKSHGFPHEVCVNTVGSSQGSPSVWRSANVKGTVCYIVVDEGEEGKPVTEKWTIRNHVKYVKAD